MTDAEQTERRNFFELSTELNAAKRDGQPTVVIVDEIESIAMHSEDRVLRRQAQRVVDIERKPVAATA